MTCPKCGGVTGVWDSKPDAESVHRKRVCKECKHIFFTVEIDAESPLPFYEAQSQYYKARWPEKKKRKKEKERG